MEKKITSIGGQALMEGIMMVGPTKTAAAFCSESGEITLENIEFEPMTKKYPILGKPFIRGIFVMIDSFRRGYKALSMSADKVMEDTGEDLEESKLDKWLNEHVGEKATSIIMGAGVVLGIALSVVLFFMLPTVLFNGLNSLTGDSIGGWRSIFEGIMRVGLFILYIWVISFQPDIKRVFMYHGAEHKTIFAYEADLPLTVENVKKQSRFHPRCGTSFMVLMLIISIIVGFFIPFTHPVTRTIAKILTIPIIMNLGYELLRLGGKYDNKLIRIITAPGLWVQRLTTKEPTDKMMEAAIVAMEAVIPEDGTDIVS